VSRAKGSSAGSRRVGKGFLRGAGRPARPCYPPAVSEIDKSPASVASMFSRIAPRYDAVNHLLSFNSDRRWRARAVRRLNGSGGRVLDLATGTGDLAIALAAAGKRVFGADFCLDMLAGARRKHVRAPLSAADGLALPFSDECFDAVTVAFGVRNFADLGRGLREIRRVLRPGGVLLVLEFSQPGGIAGAAYRVYSNRVLPWMGGLLSGSREAYRYLNGSSREWPSKEGFTRILENAGFSDVRADPMTFGVVALHRGTKR
jgi:demethylmenaquinone methyltransferase / 2-methoxy-6-polyprenyl-1,4-benzoquinol methylase